MPEPISSGQEQPLVVTAPRLPSYAAFAAGELAAIASMESADLRTTSGSLLLTLLCFAKSIAEAYFFGDFCVGLALPLAMMVSIARSLDPRVGPTWATGGAAPDTPPAGPQAKGPLWPTPAASGALEGFPYGFSLSLQVRKRNAVMHPCSWVRFVMSFPLRIAHAVFFLQCHWLGHGSFSLFGSAPCPRASHAFNAFATQVLHVARHPVWYVLLRPARQRDWAGLLLNGIHLLCPGLGLLLAVSSRTSAVWAWWKR